MSMQKSNRKEYEAYVQKLEKLVKAMVKPIKNIPFNLVIESLSNHKVLIFDSKNSNHKKILKKLIKASQCAIELINKNGIESRRVNEVGNYIEPLLKQAIQKQNMQADTPTTKSGQKKSSGYPDIEVQWGKEKFYVECKTYNINAINSTQRSFYFSPSDDFKVNFEALHFLVAFEVIPSSTNIYKVNAYKIVSLDSLSLDVKKEFNSDNKRLYSNTHGAKVLIQKAGFLIK